VENEVNLGLDENTILVCLFAISLLLDTDIISLTGVDVRTLGSDTNTRAPERQYNDFGVE